MFALIRQLIATMLTLAQSRKELMLENLALRQQLTVLMRKRPRPRFGAFDRMLWMAFRKTWVNWKDSLHLVTPETVVRWHKSGFRKYWSWISRRQITGRKRISMEIRALIFRMVKENPTWGAPKIHGELLKLGFHVGERTVLRWMQRAPHSPERAQSWKTFLANHREVIAAMDFFTVPTLRFGLLYCFFVIGHDRRKIIHFNATKHPTSEWVVHQLHEAFPYESIPKYMIHDRDAKFNPEVCVALKTMSVDPIKTSFRSPWQNGIAERFVGSCRQDLLDRVIVLNAKHLKRLMKEYLHYYHEDRTHLGLGKDTPNHRPVSAKTVNMRVVSMPRCGGLHHRYDLAA